MFSNPLLSVQEARKRICTLTDPVTLEQVDLLDAGGRVLVESPASLLDKPPWHISSMDGYAVIASDLARGSPLELVGESAAGRSWGGKLQHGQTVRIFTGARLPHAADAVLIQEDASICEKGIMAKVELAPGENVRHAGGDFRKGDKPLAVPRIMSPADIALCAAMNASELTMRRRPEIALISVGDELVNPGEQPSNEQIVASNGHMLASLLRSFGARPIISPIAADNIEQLASLIKEYSGADAIVTLGGASVGDYDLVLEALASAGLELDFHGVAARPGKPLFAGTIGGKMVVGLPGNPASALVCGYVYLLPLLSSLNGLPMPTLAHGELPLAHDLPANAKRVHFQRARFIGSGAAREIEVFQRQDSSLLQLFTRAECLAISLPNAPAQKRGSKISYMKL